MSRSTMQDFILTHLNWKRPKNIYCSRYELNFYVINIWNRSKKSQSHYLNYCQFLE